MKGKGCTERIAIDFTTATVSNQERAKILEIAEDYTVIPQELVSPLKVSESKATQLLDQLVDEGYLERNVQINLTTKDGKHQQEIEREYRPTEKARMERQHNLWQDLSMEEQTVLVHYARGSVPYYGYQQRQLAEGTMMPMKEVRKALDKLMDKSLIKHKKSSYYSPSGYQLSYDGKPLVAFISKQILGQTDG